MLQLHIYPNVWFDSNILNIRISMHSVHIDSQPNAILGIMVQ